MPKVKNAAPMDTVFNEFVYTALFKAPYEQKRQLKGKYLKAAMSEKAAKSFAAGSTKEEKEMLLSELGYEFYYVVNAGGQATKILQSILPAMRSGKKTEMSNAIAANGLFVTGDREIIRTLGLVSKVSHHPSFFLNLELLRQGYHIEKWGKRYGTEKDTVSRSIDETAKAIGRMLFNSSVSMDFSKGLLGSSADEMKVLLFLYSTSLVEPTDEDVKSRFAGRMKGKSYYVAIRSLMDSHSIDRIFGKVSITSLGIKKVSNFIDSAINKNTF
jgi:hypothetical protein